MFSFHILFLYLLLQKMEDFCLFYALASMIFYSGSCIVCNVFISDIFEMFYAFLPLHALSPPGWRGIVVTVRAGGRAAAKLAEPISL